MKMERKQVIYVQIQTRYLWRQQFAMRQMVAVPARQSRVICVFKKEFQRRRFDMAVAKDHVGLAIMADTVPDTPEMFISAEGAAD